MIAIVVPTAVASFRTHRHSELSTHWTGTASAALTVVICRLLHGHSERQYLLVEDRDIIVLPSLFVSPSSIYPSFCHIIPNQSPLLESDQRGKRRKNSPSRCCSRLTLPDLLWYSLAFQVLSSLGRLLLLPTHYSRFSRTPLVA